MVQNNDFVGAASYNIFIGIAVAIIFRSGFFFDLFWPERKETQGVRLACMSNRAPYLPYSHFILCPIHSWTLSPLETSPKGNYWLPDLVGKICSIVISFMALADAISLTISQVSYFFLHLSLTRMYQIIVASHHAYITGVSPVEAVFYIRQKGPPNLIYRKNSNCITSIMILWPGVVASFTR